MKSNRRFFSTLVVGTLCLLCALLNSSAADKSKKELNVLFIGNSYTARHNLAQVVKAMAEAGSPGLKFNVTQVIYGGRTPADHWRLGTQNIAGQYALTREQQEATVASLEAQVKKNPEDRYAKAGLKRQRENLKNFGKERGKWDVIVLQSYRDDLTGNPTLYEKFAPKFAEIAHAQGARIILYETTPTTQNAQPLTAAPDPAPVMAKAKRIAALANKVDADAAPMSLVGLRCQTQRPDLTLRFINDAHLNKVMAYLTACSLYAAFFDRSPEGLPIDSITDIRYLDNKKENRHLDRDGEPITRKFSDKDRADLQRIAWEGIGEFKKIRAEIAGKQSRQ